MVTSSDSSLPDTSWVCTSKGFDVWSLGFSSQFCCKHPRGRWEEFQFNVHAREWHEALAAAGPHTLALWSSTPPPSPTRKGSCGGGSCATLQDTAERKLSSQGRWLTSVVPAHRRLKLEDYCYSAASLG